VSVQSSFDYAIVRLVPRVEREEFVNVGVIFYCRARDFLAARVELDEPRLAALAPGLDLPAVRDHLGSLARVAAGDLAAGPIAKLPPSERFHWLVAPRSAVLQVSPVHSGLCVSPEDALERLVAQMVRIKA
jgi:hypothetical protein